MVSILQRMHHLSPNIKEDKHARLMDWDRFFSFLLLFATAHYTLTRACFWTKYVRAFDEYNNVPAMQRLWVQMLESELKFLLNIEKQSGHLLLQVAAPYLVFPIFWREECVSFFMELILKKTPPY